MSELTEENQKKSQSLKTILLPFSLTLFIAVLDQITKILVVFFIPLHKSVKIIGDLIIFRHIRNTAIAFGIGSNMPAELKQILFLAIPLCVIIFIFIFLFKTKELKPFQRWVLCAITGGGIGNLIDRFIRPSGVVDFIDMKTFGLFGFERWPVYNIADMTIVIGISIIIISMIIEEIKNRKKHVKNEQKG